MELLKDIKTVWLVWFEERRFEPCMIEDPPFMVAPSWMEQNITWVFYAVQESLLLARCHYIGHDWESDDYATPDSGYMGATCKRCGLSVGKHLY